jgi:hypothetical protein
MDRIDEEKPYGQDKYSTEKSAPQLMRELLRLLLVLLWRFLLWLIRRLLKGVLWCMETAEEGWESLVAWWHDNDTQEKVAKTKAWLKMATRKLARWSVIAAKATCKGIKIGASASWRGLVIAIKATGRGIVVGTKATIQGIIHLRPTVKRIGQLTVQGFKATLAWIRRCRRGAKLSRIRRKRAYQAFRRNGGVKGWIAHSSQSIRNGIEMFMEEDQEEATPEAVTEDDLMEEALAEGANEGKRSRQIGQSLLTHAKNFMDAD